MTAKSKIFVDGNCIVCDMEISHYKRLASSLFDIVDISSPDFDARAYGLTAAAVNKNMHVMTPDLEILIGVDAFAHIWSRLPKYRIASRLIKTPVIYQAARIGYAVFTIIRPLLPKKNRGQR